MSISTRVSRGRRHLSNLFACSYSDWRYGCGKDMPPLTIPPQLVAEDRWTDDWGRICNKKCDYEGWSNCESVTLGHCRN